MPNERLHLREIAGISTFRLTLMLGAIFAIGLVLLLGVVYFAMARDMGERSDRILHASAQRLLQVPAESLPDRIRAELSRNGARLNYLALIARDGTVVVGNVQLVPGLRAGHPLDVEPEGGRGPLRLLALRTRRGETLLVGRDIGLLRDLRNTMFKTLVVSGLLTLLCVTAAAIGFGRAPLRRVRALQRASRDIAAGDFSVRMPIAGRHDELDQFATTVNSTVEEIGRVVAQVKGVTDAIAHDLRTPLTRVRAVLHAVGRHPYDSALVVTGIAAATADLDHVLDRFAALLRISELEARRRRAGFRPIDLGCLIEQVCELYAPLAEDRGMALRAIVRPLAIEGDEKLLFEAVSNLVDNAIKFGARHILISLRRQGINTLIEIVDDGPGIPLAERDAVLRRFHRGADTAEHPGSGLGLSIVVAILYLHGFTLAFDDAHPGLVVRIRIPG